MRRHGHEDLRRFERDGNFPELTIICSRTHHAGNQSRLSTPAAHVADTISLRHDREAVTTAHF